MSLLCSLFVPFLALLAAPAAAAPEAAKPELPWRHSFAPEEPTCPDDGTPIGFDVPPPPTEERALPIMPPPRGCTGLPSIAALCQCLQPERQPVCALVKGQGLKSRKLGELAVLGATYSNPALPAPVHPQYLIRKVGGKWSALTPLSGAEATSSFEELPMGDGVLLVARTRSVQREQKSSGESVSGREHLNVCSFSASERGGATCYKSLTLATWVYQSSAAAKCGKAMHSAYRVRIDSTGQIVVEHAAGRDHGRAGKYHL